MEAIFQNLTLSDWKDVSIVLQGILMVLLVGAAAYQFRALRTENKKSRTHEICDRFTCDPVVHGAVRVVRAGWTRGDVFNNPEKYRDEIITMLNYFEALAVGIRRKIYDENLAFDYIGDVTRINAKRYLNKNFLVKIVPSATDATYIDLHKLAERWDKRPDAEAISKTAIESPANHKETA